MWQSGIRSDCSRLVRSPARRIASIAAGVVLRMGERPREEVWWMGALLEIQSAVAVHRRTPAPGWWAKALAT